MAIDSIKSIMDEIINFKDKHLKFKRPTGSYLDRSSISKATKDIIASFPVICSDTISAPTASMVAKATERNCVVMLQLLFSSAYLKGSSGREVLSKWHTNMDADMNMDDLLDIMDTFGEDAKILSDTEANQIYREMSPVISEFMNSMHSFYPESSFSEHSIQDYIIREDNNGYTMVMQMLHEKKKYKSPEIDEKTIDAVFKRIRNDLDAMEAQNRENHGSYAPDRYSDEGLLDKTGSFANGNDDYFRFIDANQKAVRIDMDMRTADQDWIYKQTMARLDALKANMGAQQFNKQLKEKQKEFKEEIKLKKKQHEQDWAKHVEDLAMKQAALDFDNIKLDFEKDKFATQNQLDKNKFDFEKQKFAYQQGQDALRQTQDDLRNGMDFFQKQLLSTDVKKYNELVPSLIVIRFQAVDPEDPRNHRPDSQAILGVKTRLVPVDSFDIINHVRSIEKNKISLSNLIRATTGEIHFCKDFIAAIDQAKIDAKQNSRLAKSSPIWRCLQNRSMGSTMSRLKKNRANDAAAITTLVVSIEEVNVLKKDYGIDLTNPKKAKFLMEQYNLLSFVIVDEQVEVARFLYDGEKNFEDYSFGVLERETGDNSYKKVINLISKVNRG